MRDPPHPECRLSICVICTAQQNPARWYDPTEQQLLPHSYHTTEHRTFTPPLTELLSAYLHTLAHPAIHWCNTDQHPPPSSHLLRANTEMQIFSHIYTICVHYYIYKLFYILGICWLGASTHAYCFFFTFKLNCDVSEKMESSDKQVSKNKDYILNVHIKIESKVM